MRRILIVSLLALLSTVSANAQFAPRQDAPSAAPPAMPTVQAPAAPVPPAAVQAVPPAAAQVTINAPAATSVQVVVQPVGWIRRFPDCLAPAGPLAAPPVPEAVPTAANPPAAAAAPGAPSAPATSTAASEDGNGGKDGKSAPAKEAAAKAPSAKAGAPSEGKALSAPKTAKAKAPSSAVASIPASAWTLPLPASFLPAYEPGVQARLTTLGCYGGGRPDGMSGPNTKAALRRWQSANGIEGNGVWSDPAAQTLLGATVSNPCR